MLSIAGLTYRYGESAVLRGVDVDLIVGEISCLIGPNGAGKSTLLKCIARILSPPSGSVVVAGRPLESYGRKELARMIAYVPQQAPAAMSLNVFEMVALGRAPYAGLAPKSHNRSIVLEALARLELTRFAFRPFRDLSGGQRQRVLVARALAQQGQLILMDEPTSNLDPYYQLETISIVQAIAAERKVAALVALHDLSIAARLSDKLILMAEGRVHARGLWRDVLTTDNLKATYGVSAIVGSDQGWPYVIPVPAV